MRSVPKSAFKLEFFFGSFLFSFLVSLNLFISGSMVLCRLIHIIQVRDPSFPASLYLLPR